MMSQPETNIAEWDDAAWERLEKMIHIRLDWRPMKKTYFTADGLSNEDNRGE